MVRMGSALLSAIDVVLRPGETRAELLREAAKAEIERREGKGKKQ